MRLRALAPAKVNLCLYLGGAREDGRHELVTLFESVSLADELVLDVLDGGSDQVSCPGVRGTNLVSRALAQLRSAGWSGPPVAIEIEKRIPVAAGLGGGSADAAAALRLAGAVAPIPGELGARVATGLGADVPSQVVPGVAIGRGAGELLERVPPLGAHAFVIVPQPFGLATAQVYRAADRLGLGRPRAELKRLAGALRAAVDAPEALPDALVVNDLHAAAVSLRAPIEQALEAVRETGAEQAMVAGSGPTVLGLFWGENAPARAVAAAADVGDRYPGATTAVPVDASFGSPKLV